MKNPEKLRILELVETLTLSRAKLRLKLVLIRFLENIHEYSDQNFESKSTVNKKSTILVQQLI